MRGARGAGDVARRGTAGSRSRSSSSSSSSPCGRGTMMMNLMMRGEAGGGGGAQGSVMMSAQAAAEAAVRAVGCGYDLTGDLGLCRAKKAGRLLDFVDGARAVRELVLPGGAVVPDVPVGIVADKGERSRLRSDVLSFVQMAEQVNQSLSLPGKIPSGPFNAMFDYRGCWHRDAASTRSLCFDGRFVELYTVEAPRPHLSLHDRVARDVPPLWDPAALAGFIDKYGTHVIVGVKMGGKDVVCVKQLKGSTLTQSDVQAHLKKLADDTFSRGRSASAAMDGRRSSRRQNLGGPGSAAWNTFRSPVISTKDDVVGIHVRRGGVHNGQGHDEWLPTISSSPDVISMVVVPITSLLGGARGRGLLNHAINLYLRYKPPIEDLQQFLEFQLPRQWAPEFGELPLALGPQRKKKNSLPSLQFNLMGPKLRVNTAKVDSGNRPVTGIRLFLEGKNNNRLGVHLQHLSATPAAIAIGGEAVSAVDVTVKERDYLEPVRSPLLTHACTAPVQYNGARIDDCAAVVTRAWLEVREACLKKVLFLRLGFSGVASTKIRRSEWDGPLVAAPKSGSFSGLFSSRLSAAAAVAQNRPPEGKVEVNSAVFPMGPPVPLPVQRMARYVDTTEVTRGPDDLPGYWVVTGAKLCVEGGKVALKVKYSLLIAVQDDAADF